MRVLQLCGRAPTRVPPPELGGERWVIGSAFPEHVETRYTRIFDVHTFDFLKEKRPADNWAWYGQQDKPVYLVDTHPEIPMSVRFPLQEIGERFGPRAACAFSSTVDHMMALALYEGGFDQIRLEGIRLNSIEEWVLQRECLAYWIGRAEAMGVDVVSDPEAALCAPELVYGYFTPTGARRAPGQPVLVYGVPA